MTAETDHDLSREPVATHEPSPRSGSIALVLLVATGLVAVAIGLMTLGRAQAQRGAKDDAIKSYESALKLNRKKTPTEIRDYDTATKALSDLKK